MSSNRSWTCPYCGQDSSLFHSQSQRKVCPECSALSNPSTGQIIQYDTSFSAQQDLFELGETYSLSMIGLGSSWRLLGVVNLAESAGNRWDEGFFVNSHGDSRWLSFEEGELYAYSEVHPDRLGSLPRTPAQIAQRDELRHGKAYYKDCSGTVIIRGAAGEFFDEFEVGDHYHYWDGYDSEDEDALSAEWSSGEGEITYSVGRWISVSRFNRASGSAGAEHGSSSGQLIPVWLFVLIFLGSVASLAATGYDNLSLIHQQQLKPAQLTQSGGLIDLLSEPFFLPADEPLLIELSFPDELLPALLNIYLIKADLDLETVRRSPDKGASSPNPMRELSLGTTPHHGEGFIELTDQKQLPEVLTADLARSYHESYEFQAYTPQVALSSQLAVAVSGQYRIYYRGISEPYAGILPEQQETEGEATNSQEGSAASSRRATSLPPPAPYSTFDFFIFTGYVDQQYKVILGMGLMFIFILLMVIKGWLNNFADFWVSHRLSRASGPDRRYL